MKKLQDQADSFNTELIFFDGNPQKPYQSRMKENARNKFEPGNDPGNVGKFIFLQVHQLTVSINNSKIKLKETPELFIENIVVLLWFLTGVVEH